MEQTPHVSIEAEFLFV